MFKFLKGNFLVLDVPICIKILKIICFYYLVTLIYSFKDTYYMINMLTFSEGICLGK